MWRTLGLAAVLVLSLAATGADAQPSRCADCHFANPGALDERHLHEWDVSPHGRNAVGCEGCHGGDATTFEPFQAHRDILSPGDPASPVAAANLPATCGRCHAGPFVRFQDSRHYALLQQGESRGPTCVTCHGEVAAHLLSPEGLERRCLSCHDNDSAQPHPEFPPRARSMLMRVEEVRAAFDAAERLIEHVEGERRVEVEEALRQAEVPLIEAVREGHAFVFDRMEERLDTAQRRIAHLLTTLVDPPGGAR